MVRDQVLLCQRMTGDRYVRIKEQQKRSCSSNSIGLRSRPSLEKAVEGSAFWCLNLIKGTDRRSHL